MTALTSTTLTHICAEDIVCETITIHVQYCTVFPFYDHVWAPTGNVVSHSGIVTLLRQCPLPTHSSDQQKI